MLHVLYVTPTPQRTESYAQGDLRPGPATQHDGEDLDEAFAGCDQWTFAPPPQRSSDTGLSPWPASSSTMTGNAAAVRVQEPPAL